LESCITEQTVVGSIDDPENPESTGISDDIINIQTLNSEGPVEITLSLELGSEPPGSQKTGKKAAEPVAQKELCLDDKSVVVCNPSNGGFSKFRRIKKFFKVGGRHRASTHCWS
jgi:hypothetical protein